ncbi:MAG: glycine-rich protein, partial [Clostridia bacterium]
VMVEKLTYSFIYKGLDEYWTVPVSGRYKIELFGAQGGQQSYGYRGGLGGYTYGEYVFNKNDSVRIRVGGVGGYGGNSNSPGAGGWPDGQNGQADLNYTYYANAGGGGKSDVSLNNNILIAAGGGGGGNVSAGGDKHGGYQLYPYGLGGLGGNGRNDMLNWR